MKREKVRNYNDTFFNAIVSQTQMLAAWKGYESERSDARTPPQVHVQSSVREK